MRFESFLRASAMRFPDKTALVAGNRRLTYSQLDDISDELAQGLIHRGIETGDRVVLFLDNSVEAVVSIFAVLKAGGVFSPVNPSIKTDKLSYILNNCRAKAIIAQQKTASVAADATAAAPSVAFSVIADGESVPAGFGALHWNDVLAVPEFSLLQSAPGINVDLAMLIYTSGSTGFPKGVMMTHQNVVAAATSITTYLENTADDIILNVLPVAFDYGLYQVLMAIKVGATLVLEKSFAFPQVILKRCEEERVTGLPLVPTMAAILVGQRNLAPGALPHLRYITNTAAALPPTHIEKLQALFPHAALYSMYGLTECKRCTWLPPQELKNRISSVGVAIPGTEAYVVDDDGRRVGPDVVGELVIRGAHVMKGYWENPEATAKALRPGPYPWEHVLYTGDLFRTDSEGFLYFVGRKDDIIKSRGEKVPPKEVENVIYALPGVAEVAVIGVPDAVLGSAIKAVVALEPGTDIGAQDVIRHCARFLEDYMVPKLVEFRPSLPKTDSGKISRRLVSEAERGQNAAL
ncbi:Long-chain-fatty-acid--CoA ligase [Hyphomicrobium sulfonivorans]|uniref:Long-chain-fatty-acid--CoA ligase n=1 Tax=Hyphomicrobium sulfonivorans TaxID=121290 RepID=A0A109BNF3_HYPSL|nr:class I adenylate-forming enzyme family protein [Hyphomicrobium sulfonivorans]KWT72036.1 Long-chain-fatty-acid--CoA ligase [Hyphomicrobium sulfonivorans]